MIITSHTGRVEDIMVKETGMVSGGGNRCSSSCLGKYIQYNITLKSREILM